MHWFEHRIPPPIVGLLLVVAMWVVARMSPSVSIAASIRVPAAIALFALGLAIALAGNLAFRRARTTVNPLKPASASTLVVAGVYRYTRNPMYLGLTLALVAWAVYLAASAALLGPVVFVAFMTRFQVVPEERALADRFGSQFAEYRQRVRRWI
jgi:protein-S-isoprenylcysteine O-methyltransferase Ste14